MYRAGGSAAGGDGCGFLLDRNVPRGTLRSGERWPTRLRTPEIPPRCAGRDDDLARGQDDDVVPGRYLLHRCGSGCAVSSGWGGGRLNGSLGLGRVSFMGHWGVGVGYFRRRRLDRPAGGGGFAPARGTFMYWAALFKKRGGGFV